MKLSTETLAVLKNFANINQGIMFRKGNTLKTVSSHKNILAQAEITEDVPVDFGVYDLNEFLSVVSLHKDDPTFDFDEKNILISGHGGRSKITYRFCEPSMIVIPPDKELTLPSTEIKFELTASDLEWIMRAASVLSSPQLAIDSDGEKLKIVTLDTANDAAHTDALELNTVGNGNKYRMIFKTENMKMISADYDVTISSKGIAHFKMKNKNIQYWITTEAGSKFESK
jgi:hypothetical protein